MIDFLPKVVFRPFLASLAGCTKAFSQLSNLQSHSRCHQTDKPYKCNSCYKCFSDEQSLFEHIPKHKESKHIKTHICSYCGKSYTQETYLAKHMQKHADRTDKRPPIIAGPSNMTQDLYWPKMDPSLYQVGIKVKIFRVLFTMFRATSVWIHMVRA